MIQEGDQIYKRSHVTQLKRFSLPAERLKIIFPARGAKKTAALKDHEMEGSENVINIK